jgi:ApbE superfamily uncharacterized protein (UPF0280 family)
LDNSPDDNDENCRCPDTNIHNITPEHIEAASHLPKEHSVRLLLARASIDSYLNSEEDFSFSTAFYEVPEFAGDLLQELREALKSVRFPSGGVCTFDDPFSEEELNLRP